MVRTRLVNDRRGLAKNLLRSLLIVNWSFCKRPVYDRKGLAFRMAKGPYRNMRENKIAQAKNEDHSGFDKPHNSLTKTT